MVWKCFLVILFFGFRLWRNCLWWEKNKGNPGKTQGKLSEKVFHNRKGWHGFWTS
jgi:hypothetical protein